MINLQKQDDDIVKGLKYVKKDGCPNVFISGKSLSAMEKLGMRMVEKLEEQQVLRFKGICKHFTILMPYYNNHQEAISFMKHLLNSISIARDCYDSYCGFVLIEAAEEWGEEGSNEFLKLFYEYVRSETQIKFFLLFPAFLILYLLSNYLFCLLFPHLQSDLWTFQKYLFPRYYLRFLCY